MINFIIAYKGRVIRTTKWTYLPRVGEVIRLQEKLYTVTNVIYDIDAIANHYGYEAVIEVK